MEFIMTRDRDKVLAEGSLSIERLYAEATPKVREEIGALPVGVLRRQLAVAEAALVAARQAPKVVERVVGDRVLMKALQEARSEVRQLMDRNEMQARRIAELRKKLERKSR